MNWLEVLLPPLLHEGRLVFQQSPRTEPSTSKAKQLLEAAFETYRLDVAGPTIPFDADTALEASVLVIRAGWALVNHDLPSAEVKRWMTMSHAPTTAAQHLSADLVFRLLPQIRKRAMARFDPDPLVERLTAILRQWPLSGVLANLDNGPETPPKLCGHPGLMMLYAERWMPHRNPHWRPDETLNESLELVGNL